ncbi:MAG TPA: MlaD family protein [Pirellulaceae bacterium]|nr:MlaD family protein [Pirellulaceae bacterium]
MSGDESIPEARSAPLGTRRRWSYAWLLTLVAAIAAFGLMTWRQQQLGELIEVTFPEGHGLEAGASLRHRGIEVGKVERLELTDDASRIRVAIRLVPEASKLAVEGSQYWIVRPQVRPGRIDGLETIVGAKYVAVQPGPPTAGRRTTFEGIETPIAFSEDGTTRVEIEFREGHSLAVGDAVKHRGIRVGEVDSVTLADDLSGIVVGVRLFGAESPFARGGSRYWIERPSITLTEVRGLETLVGGTYLAAEAGTDERRPGRFVGIEQPRIGPLPEGGLEIVFEAPGRGPLKVGTPIDHRGVEIGRIVSVSLSGDATSVEARAWIEPAYRSLVREGSRFWNRGGVEMSIGITGVDVSADSLQELLVGGISMATPEEQAGAAVSTGHRFAVAAEAESEWSEWSPRIPIGAHHVATGQELPRCERVEVSWTERRWGFRSQRRRSGWGLWAEGGRLFGPRSLLELPEGALDGGVLEVAGRRYDLSTLVREQYGELVALRIDDKLADLPPWPMSRIRFAKGPEDALLLLPEREPVPLVGEKQAGNGGLWRPDGSIGVSEDECGAPVISVADGALIGMLGWFDESGAIAPLVEPH